FLFVCFRCNKSLVLATKVQRAITGVIAHYTSIAICKITHFFRNCTLHSPLIAFFRLFAAVFSRPTLPTPIALSHREKPVHT
ncbi:MAG: hypothetical protein II539_07695, partial [Muribaculaceae bacterium]|nr:hypothetical protein [Muribaculaceae bacterium]